MSIFVDVILFTPCLQNTVGTMHAPHHPLQTIQSQRTNDPLSSGSKETNAAALAGAGRGADENLKIQQQLLDKAGKNKESGTGNTTTNAAPKEGRGKNLKLSRPNFLNKFPSFGSSSGKDTASVQAGISYSAVVTGQVAMIDLASSTSRGIHDVTGSVCLL